MFLSRMVIMQAVLMILMTLDITRSMRLQTLPSHRMRVRLGFVDYVVSQDLKAAILEAHFKPVTEAPLIPTEEPTETPTEVPTKDPTVPPTEAPTETPIEFFECNENGYLEYLSKWDETQKCTSRDPSTAEFQTRLEYFVDSCEKVNSWNSPNDYPMELTFYADWHPDEFYEITSTRQRYTGISPPTFQTIPVYNNSNHRHLMPSLDPCDDVGGGDLRSTICKPQNCSVSWAFAVTNSIEYAIKKYYLDEFDQSVSVALSAQELIDCVPMEHDLDAEGKVCEGMSIAWGFDYVVDYGISFRQYYPHTNVFGQCKVIPDENKYHIAGYEKPAVYNKLGLLELALKGPTAVALALDPEFFQFYQSDRAIGPYFNATFWKPSVYGVIVEYSQYEPEGTGTYPKWPYFSIETRLRACDSMIFRIPILEDTEESFHGSIFVEYDLTVIRPIVRELLPTIEDYPASPTEELIPGVNHLIVSSDGDCGQLSSSHWAKITVNAGYCNSMTGDLVISNYPNLESITIESNSTSAMNTLANLNSLTITNNPLLKSIIVGNGYGGYNFYGGCIHTKSVNLTSFD